MSGVQYTQEAGSRHRNLINRLTTILSDDMGGKALTIADQGDPVEGPGRKLILKVNGHPALARKAGEDAIHLT